MAITASVGSGGVNNRQDVTTVQLLINAQNLAAYQGTPVTVDGLIGNQTISAVKLFQARVVGFRIQDGRVDPGGRTLSTLIAKSMIGGPGASPTPGTQPPGAPTPTPAPVPTPTPVPNGATTRIVYRHGNIRPGKGEFESTVTVSGPFAGTFRGSIYPDDMSVKGRVKDGTYDLNLCFHRKNGVPAAEDLIVKLKGDLRPALTLNRGTSIQVISDNPAKTSSQGINLHNGFIGNRGSDGCLTIQKNEWSRFISPFLSAYPSLSDWNQGNLVGLKIGTVQVMP